SLIAILPQFILHMFNVPFYFGGTSVLIVVGVAMDVVNKIESHLITHNYDGFLSKGRIKSRGGSW
ncbi:MAG: preprotein translocase subunit SecY, partial [Calditerrivibrio sp.]|nr:preprotein translocase subunit SecY [Calditerrivibrio sp.]